VESIPFELEESLVEFPKFFNVARGKRNGKVFELSFQNFIALVEGGLLGVEIVNFDLDELCYLFKFFVIL
jgi:hypothetical protein